MTRSWPNIVLTGTPGTGKSTHATQLASSLPAMKHIDVGQLAKSQGLTLSYDEEWGAYEVDEERMLDHLEPMSGGRAPLTKEEREAGEQEGTEEEGEGEGGLILDWHTCDAYPERWVDLVVVLTCDHSKLWTRLEKRNYALTKIQENNTAEIMQVSLNEAREAYDEACIVELRSEEVGDVENNVERLVQWVAAWRDARGLADQ